MLSFDLLNFNIFCSTIYTDIGLYKSLYLHCRICRMLLGFRRHRAILGLVRIEQGVTKWSGGRQQGPKTEHSKSSSKPSLICQNMEVRHIDNINYTASISNEEYNWSNTIRNFFPWGLLKDINQFNMSIEQKALSRATINAIKPCKSELYITCGIIFCGGGFCSKYSLSGCYDDHRNWRIFLFEEHSMKRRLKLTKTDHVDGSRKPGQLRTFKLPLLVYVRVLHSPCRSST